MSNNSLSLKLGVITWPKLLSILMGIGSVVWAFSLKGVILWSDKHNEEIFTPRKEFVQYQSTVTETLNRIEKNLEVQRQESMEQRTDIKEILRSQRAK